jgi:uncharacterized phage protein (TIGR01671 family)
MRDFKFRAWVPEVNMMIPYKYLNLELEDGYGGVKDISIYDVLKDVENQVTSNFELMQYTGLDDKNNKNVFEGDIVELDSHCYDGDYGEHYRNFNGLFRVEYDDGIAGFCLTRINGNVDGWYLSIDSVKDLTVVGNIYENVEMSGV